LFDQVFQRMTFYVITVQSNIQSHILEYARAVWHPGLAKNWLKVLSVFDIL